MAKRWKSNIKLGFSFLLSVLLISLMSNSCITQLKQDSLKPRTIVTTDGEVDDMDSFIRMLLYSNEFNIEGLIYSSSMWHYSGDGKGTLFTSEMPMTAKMYGQRTDLRWTGTLWMEELIDKYALIYPTLIKHDSNYPVPEYLKNIIRIGNIEFEGEMSKDTEGSNYIRSILLDNKPGHVYLQMWGGTNTVARALKSIEDGYKTKSEWKDIYRKVSDKAVLYIILDQDVTYRKYVAVNWPEIKVIYNSFQFSAFAYWWYRSVPESIKLFLDGKWFSENIKFNHGPLLNTYYLWGDSQKITGDPEHTQGDPEDARKQNRKQYDFLSEGDSPAYFYLVDFGLRGTENPTYGGLGGRFIQSVTDPGRYEDGRNVTDLDPFSGRSKSSWPQARWFEVFQNDFAARADWCVNDYEGANHPPVVKLVSSGNVSLKPGRKVKLIGTATDPDGDQLEYLWWQYNEAGTYDRSVPIQDQETTKASFIVPAHAVKGQTIHIVFQVTDNGSPNLTRYQRTIVTVI